MLHCDTTCWDILLICVAFFFWQLTVWQIYFAAGSKQMFECTYDVIRCFSLHHVASRRGPASSCQGSFHNNDLLAVHYPLRMIQCNTWCNTWCNMYMLGYNVFFYFSCLFYDSCQHLFYPITTVLATLTRIHRFSGSELWKKNIFEYLHFVWIQSTFDPGW